MVFRSARDDLKQISADLTEWERDVGDDTDSNEARRSDEAVRGAEHAATATLILINERATAIGSILHVGQNSSSLSDGDQ
jgi:hypothetical protein